MTRVSSLLISVLLLASASASASATGMAQAPMAGVDAATISRIRGEAMIRSQAMETHCGCRRSTGRAPRARRRINKAPTG